MYGKISNEFRINGIAPNFQDGKRNANRYKKPKKSFETVLGDESKKDAVPPEKQSRIDITY